MNLEERLQRAKELKEELLQCGHPKLAERIEEIIEELEEELEDEYYIGQYGIWGYLGLSEKSFF